MACRSPPAGVQRFILLVAAARGEVRAERKLGRECTTGALQAYFNQRTQQSSYTTRRTRHSGGATGPPLQQRQRSKKIRAVSAASGWRSRVRRSIIFRRSISRQSRARGRGTPWRPSGLQFLPTEGRLILTCCEMGRCAEAETRGCGGDLMSNDLRAAMIAARMTFGIA